MLSKRINIERIQRRIEDLSEIGRTADGGVTRLVYSDEETEAFDYVRERIDDDFEVWTDQLGNLYASPDPDADRSVYVGSHLDSVYNGGKLDGTLGVVAALDAVEAVAAADPVYPPTLAVFRAEESTRFRRHTIGSRGALGMLTTEVLSATDQQDIPVWQAMESQGIEPEDLSEPTIDLDRVAAFLELHIEQGRVLDEADDRVGIVTSIRAPIRYRATVVGDYDHSGATPMGLRRDALAAATEMITAVEETGKDADVEGDIVTTVGDVTAVDGAINKVCGEVSFVVDVRSNDATFRDAVEADVVDRLSAIAGRRDVDLDLDTLDRSAPVQLDETVVDALTSEAETVGTEFRRMPSGGGHDAMNFQLTDVPTGMVFVPSVDGISHNSAEETDPEAVAEGTEILVRTMAEYDG
jgi:hydantoinase/carbamoylase family amidase